MRRRDMLKASGALALGAGASATALPAQGASDDGLLSLVSECRAKCELFQTLWATYQDGCAQARQDPDWDRLGLSRFADYCEANGLAPETASDRAEILPVYIAAEKDVISRYVDPALADQADDTSTEAGALIKRVVATNPNTLAGLAAKARMLSEAITDTDLEGYQDLDHPWFEVIAADIERLAGRAQ